MRDLTMRAAVLSPDPDEPPLTVRTIPAPSTRHGWVIVQIRAAALNRLDQMTLADRESEAPGSILGSDGAGIVAEVGTGVSTVEVGAEVIILPSLCWGDSPAAPGPRYEILGSPSHGTHAEYVSVPAQNVFPRPRHLSWVQAAALPLAGLTAWRALVTRGRLAPGETVAIGAASSGVGSLAIQIAAAFGARVIAVTSGTQKADAARQLGADAVIDRSSEDIADRLRELTDGVGTDLSLDPTGSLWQRFVDGARPGGRIVAVGKAVSDVASVRVQSLYWKQVDLLGSSMGSPADFRELLRHVEANGWAPHIDSTYTLEDISAAYRRLDSVERVGKVVIDLASPGQV